MNPDILYDIVTISDPFGPTITDESLQCIVLSEETRKGGEAINIKRKEKVCGWCGIEGYIFVCFAYHLVDYGTKSKLSHFT